MMKQRTLDAEQEKLFGNIQVYATEHLNDENTGEIETNGEQDN